MEATARTVETAGSDVHFEDGLGHRYLLASPSGDSAVEALVFRPSLVKARSFEFALRERVARLGSFSHAAFPALRGVDRTSGVDATLRLLSEAVEGIRLSALLERANEAEVRLDTGAALCLVRQLAAALAALHERARDLSHGALAAERVVLTPGGRLVLVEHGTGAALQQLGYTAERYWTELRVALPPSGGAVLFDQRVDVLQLGVLSLGLLLGRSLGNVHIAKQLGELVSAASAVTPRGGVEPLPPGLRGWLLRALQLDPLRSFSSAVDARRELDRILGDTDDVAPLSSLEAFLDRVDQAASGDPAVPAQDLAEPRRGDVVLADIDAALAIPAKAPPADADSGIEPSNLLPFPRTVDRPAPTTPGANAAPVTLADEVSAARRSQACVQDAGPGASPAAGSPDTPQTDGQVVSAALLEPAPTEADTRTVKASPALDRIDAAMACSVSTSTSTSASVASLDDPEARHAPTMTTRSPLTRAAKAGVLPALLAAMAGYTVALAAPFAPVRVVSPGAVELVTGPAGVEAFIDGTFRGLTPLAVSLAPGLHTIALHRPDADPLTLPVTISSGMRVAQFVDLPVGSGFGLDQPTVAVAPEAGAEPGRLRDTGIVSVVSDATLFVFEGHTLLGSSRDRLELTVGRHELTLVDESSGIRTTRSVVVDEKKPTVVRVAMPTGLLAVTATPKADVWVDGDRRGATPIALLSLRAGAHDVVFRHPELGDRRKAVFVTAGDVLRLNVDLRAK